MNPSKNTIKRLVRTGPPKETDSNGKPYTMANIPSMLFSRKIKYYDMCDQILHMSKGVIDPSTGEGCERYKPKKAKP